MSSLSTAPPMGGRVLPANIHTFTGADAAASLGRHGRTRHHVQPGISALARLQKFLAMPKGLLLLAFVPLLVVAGTGAGWSVALPHVLAGIAGACLVDLLVVRITWGVWQWPSGGLLSGLICAMVLGPETHWMVTLAVGGFATASKHLLVYRRLNVFNPAALALLLSIPLFATGQSWWGALADLPWPWVVVLLACGALVVDRINRFPLALTFTGTLFALFAALSVASLVGALPPAYAAQLGEMFRAPFLHATLFLALFMLTDPPTSPAHVRDQVWIGALVAGVCVAAQMLGAGQGYLLIGVLAGNLALFARRWIATR